MKKVFVIGDSISCYYGKHLQVMLSGFLEYDRKGGTHQLKDLDDCTDGINGGDSSMVLTYLKSVVNMEFFNPNYLLLNCGSHDTKMPNGKLQVPEEFYRKNLQAILDIAADKGIKAIWVRTAPVNKHTTHWSEQEVLRRQNDVDRYNRIADEIMARNNIPIIDLYSFSVNLGADIYLNGVDSVHFNDDAAKLQAAFIAGALASICR